MPDLELEPENHRYTLRGAEIPGVTQVLSAVGASPNFHFLTEAELNYYRDRGHAVHKAIEMVIRGTFDRRFPDCAWLKPYVTGWERFVNDYQVEVMHVRPAESSASVRLQRAGERHKESSPFVEKPLHHEVYRYGVTPDVVAFVQRGSEPEPIELKATSAHGPATEIQTAAQELAIENALGLKGSGRRWAVRLIPEEPYYEPKKYTERGDRSTWIGMLSTFNWLTKYSPRALRNLKETDHDMERPQRGNRS